MSTERRMLTYPLAPLHQQENWRLEILQSEVASAARRHAESLELRASLLQQHRDAAKSFAPGVSTVIDPQVAAQRLNYLRAVQQRMEAATHRVLSAQAECEAVQSTCAKQRVRYESIEAHRCNHVRDASAEAERRHGAEVDREWLARIQWRRDRHGVDRAGHDGDVPAPGPDLCIGDAP